MPWALQPQAHSEDSLQTLLLLQEDLGEAQGRRSCFAHAEELLNSIYFPVFPSPSYLSSRWGSVHSTAVEVEALSGAPWSPPVLPTLTSLVPYVTLHPLHPPPKPSLSGLESFVGQRGSAYPEPCSEAGWQGRGLEGEKLRA